MRKGATTTGLTSVEVLGQPAEAIGITATTENAAHKYLNGAGKALNRGTGLFAGGCHETKAFSELRLREGVREIDLVAKNEERNVCEFLTCKKTVKLLLCLLDTLSIMSINKVDDGITANTVLLPEATYTDVTTKIVSIETDVTHHKLLLSGLRSGSVLRKAGVLEHMKQGSFSCIIKAQEEDLSILIIKTEPAQNIEEPIEQKHLIFSKKLLTKKDYN